MARPREWPSWPLLRGPATFTTPTTTCWSPAKRARLSEQGIAAAQRGSQRQRPGQYLSPKLPPLFTAFFRRRIDSSDSGRSSLSCLSCRGAERRACKGLPLTKLDPDAGQPGQPGQPHLGLYPRRSAG